jgi:hypothetical protein
LFQRGPASIEEAASLRFAALVEVAPARNPVDTLDQWRHRHVEPPSHNRLKFNGYGGLVPALSWLL